MGQENQVNHSQHHYSAELVSPPVGKEKSKGKLFKAYVEKGFVPGRQIEIDKKLETIIDAREFQHKRGEFLISTRSGLYRLQPTLAIWRPK